jgi:acyl dehydratase
MKLGADNYFEDFAVGDRFRHWRGKTITDVETHLLSQLMMNTSEGHFNELAMRDSPFGTVVTFGVVVASIIWGLASQDTAEHAVAELGVDRLVLRSPTRSGDTLFAESEVLAVSSTDSECGHVLFRHVGVNQHDEVVCEMHRRVSIRKRPREEDDGTA